MFVYDTHIAAPPEGKLGNSVSLIPPAFANF